MSDTGSTFVHCNTAGCEHKMKLDYSEQGRQSHAKANGGIDPLPLLVNLLRYTCDDCKAKQEPTKA